jgi:diguanylate cyclase (GGDEF)-like protein/PAS domain S-box-containing protein
MTETTANLAGDAPAGRARTPSTLADARRRVQRALAVGGVLTLVLVLVVATAVISDLRRDVTDESRAQMRALSLVLADRVAFNFHAVELIEKALIEDIREQEPASAQAMREKLSSEALHRDLAARISGLSYISALSLWDPDEEMLNSSLVWPAPKGRLEGNPAQRFRDDPTLQTIISEPARTMLSGSWAIRVIRKLTGADGAFVGMVVGTIRLSEFENYFKRVKPPGDGTIVMFSTSGALMARFPAHPESIGNRFTAEQLGAGVLTEPFVAMRQPSPMDEHDRFIVSRRLDNYPVILVLTASVDEVLAGWRGTAVWLVMASLALMGVISVVVWATRRRITATLQTQNLHLSSAMENMGEGLALFDADGRLIICNARYSAMYNLPDALRQQGTPLRRILEYRRDTGMLRGDPEVYEAELRAQLMDSGRAAFVRQTEDGRLVAMSNHPIKGGGWIATHRDITEASAREKSFQLLFDNNPVPMCVIDSATLAFLAVNEAALALYGYSRDEFLGMTLADIRPGQSVENLKRRIRQRPTTEGGDLWQHRTASGALIDVTIYARNLHYAGVEARLVAVHDVTASRKLEEESRRSRTFLNAIIETIPFPIIVKRVPPEASDARDWRVELVNRAAAEMFSLPQERWTGQTLNELFPPDNNAGAIARDNEALKSGLPVVLSDHTMRLPTQQTRNITSRRVVIRNDAGAAEHMIALLEDVTDRREAEARISRMAHFDPLTNLANRASFDACFAATIAEAAELDRQVAVICMDLDGFKEVNDTFGHSAGDEVLRQVAARLSAVADGAFLARFGGDEFTLLVGEQGDFASSRAMAAKLLAAMRDELVVDGHNVTVRLTLGIAVYPLHGDDGETVIANADRALYRAKAARPGTALFFDSDMDAQIRERRAMQDDLRLAVAQGALTLHYQPQVDMDGRPIGFEALVRWNCPQRGMVPPATFVPLAEESLLILELGAFVLRAACREAAKWTEPLTVAVNISPRQFRQTDLPELIHGILLDTGLAPHRLELEITEGVLIEDTSRALSILRRVKALGVAIALDDFGTGYSSLSYLHAFPFDRIKIDRGFVCDLGINRHSMAIVKAVISLARSIGVPVLAEGVETVEQRDILAAQGCDAMQGHLFGRPLAIEAYAPMMDGGEASDAEKVA